MDNDQNDTIRMLFENILLWTFIIAINSQQWNERKLVFNEYWRSHGIVCQAQWWEELSCYYFNDDLWCGSSEIEIFASRIGIHCLILHSPAAVYKDTDEYI